ncbi:MAG: MBOAT family O-acyltransferase [Huintestinicola sp.]|uniref:MBOAT family O-acyltransferase n=1 Tax=Huintestinicola sp. TaxID=2981661 RepID=UPI003F085D9A
MVFSSTVFLFIFLPVVLILYFLSAEKYRNVILLLASLFFYAWGEPKNILVMLASILINYGLGFLVQENRKGRSLFLAFSVIYNLGVLYVFKYLNFTVDTINSVFGSSIQIQEILLPIGISFYTFQIMSYVIDVYRGNVKVQKNLINLALYVSMFPQLIAGPIVRYVDVEKQILDRKTTWDNAYTGVMRFSVGFSKKVLIADQLAKIADTAFGGEYGSIFVNWIGIIAYSLQIFFDFSGYSDMAIGLGKIFGFDFPENFNYPYISQSIQEFWRRWHISLSSWFRDYLYIPLGGSRAGKMRTYINLIIVFFMTGLWHGASFNFIVWGLFYAVFLIIERLGFSEVLKKIPSVFRHIYALFVILIGWVFFRADSLSAAIEFIKGMFTLSGSDYNNFRFVMTNEYWFFLIAGIIFSIPHSKLTGLIKKNSVKESIYQTCVLLIFLVAVCYMVGSGYSPFLYFRF